MKSKLSESSFYNLIMFDRVKFLALTTVIIASWIISVSTTFADDVCGPMTPTEEQTLKLQQENSNLGTRIQEFEKRRCISDERLLQKKVLLLKEIATDVQQQRKSMAEFQGFVGWMSQHLAGFNKYIKAGSYAAAFGKMLPIPYAGQASVFTKFASEFAITLNESAVSINSYLITSAKFIALVEGINPSPPFNQKNIDEASTVASTTLLKDMNDTHLRLATVSNLSSGAMSFLETLNNYVSGTDEFWNKAKGFFRKDVDAKEKSFISESTELLKNKVAGFTTKLNSFSNLTEKQNARLKSMAVYDELLAELNR